VATGDEPEAVRRCTMVVLVGAAMTKRERKPEGVPVAARLDVAKIAAEVCKHVEWLKAKFPHVSEAGVEMAAYEAMWRVVERRGGKP
jgi:hypothetical protein